MVANTPPAPALHPPDPRRAIPRHAWLTNRARNALQRPAFIGAISIGTFVTAIVSMVVVPESQRHPAPVIRSAPRPDTMSVIANAELARTRITHADSLLLAARQTLTAQNPAKPADSTTVTDSTQRDSVRLRVAALNEQIARTEQAPLPASYKALASLPELRSDPRVRPLVDSLAEIERERDGFGAVGGVDPIFVALTSRASEIGRAIRAIAIAHRDAMRQGIGDIAPPAPTTVAAAPAIDTLPMVQARDSARAAMQLANDSLARRRQVARAMDLEEERVREEAAAVAPPLALLASAFVLSAVFGFAAAFIGELRRPRVTDANELERVLGVRVLSTIETPMPSVDRGRRQADRAAPPYFDPGAEGYQLAYLGLATEHPTLLSATVTGDDPAVAALVACNLAAVAADEARNTLVLDLDPACMGAAALRTRVSPGVVDVVRGSAWPDATVSARVGRDKSVDLVPFGLGDEPAHEALEQLLRRDAQRLSRYYDAVFTIVSPAQAESGLSRALPSAEIVYCARPGTTALRALREQLDAMRAAGAHVRGIVLWSAERPMLPTPKQAAAKSRRGGGVAKKQELART